MSVLADAPAPRLETWTARDLDRIRPLRRLPAEERFAMDVVARVLPFRVNRYVVEELIDWSAVPDDPIYQLVFPQPGMLSTEHFERVAGPLRAGRPAREVEAAAHAVRMELNPHPAEQRSLNVPRLDGKPLPGLQHKYRETVLFFPSRGQTCHTYCAYCFRWPQFVRRRQLLISGRESRRLHAYLARHHEVTDLLVTGGDPMVMTAERLAEIVEPLLAPEYAHLQTIRIGTKALSWWPYRFLTDEDADDVLRLFERVVGAGRHLALVAHVTHARELQPAAARAAVRRVLSAGAQIRTQAPVVRHVNDDAAVWEALWREQVRLGMFPYYMFVVRDTGARRHFEIPLERAWEIYRDATRGLSGLGRTAHGPSMSAGPGKVEILGVGDVGGERVFALRFLQGRDPRWVQRLFYARYDPRATWLDDLRPAFGAEAFFFEREYRRRCEAAAARA